MARPTLSNQSQMLLTVVLVACIVVSLVVESYVPAAVAVVLAVLLLVVRTPGSPGRRSGPDEHAPRGRR